MPTTPKWGIHYDAPADLALGRKQDQTQANTVEAALSTVEGIANDVGARAEALAEQTREAQAQAAAELEDTRTRVESVAARTLLEVDAPTAGTYTVGTNYRAFPALTSSVLPGQLAALGVTAGRMLVEVDAPTAGTYEVGTNYRSRTVGGGVSADFVEKQVSSVPDVAQRELLRDRARRITAAPRRTSAKAVVAIVADDYPVPTLDIFAPLMRERSLPWSWALNGNTFDAGYSYAAFSRGKTWADVRALAERDGVEICNHGATHADVASVGQMYAEIIGSRDRLRAETGQDVLGFVPPGCDFPEGVNFKTAPLVSTKGELALVGTAYDRLVNYAHAWATGTMKNPAVDDFVHPLDGSPRMNAGRQWLDFAQDAAVKPGGIADALIDKAVSYGGGVILGLHACYIEGGGLQQRMTLAGLEGFLDRLKTLADRGEIEVVTLTQWHYTRLEKR